MMPDWNQDFLDLELARFGTVPVTILSLLTFLGSVAVVVLGAALLYRLLLRMLSKLSFVEASDQLRIARTAAALCLVFGLLGSLETLGVPVGYTFFSLGSNGISLYSLALFATLTSTVLTTSHIAGRSVTVNLLPHSQFDEGLRHAIGRITYYILLVLGMMATLQTVGIQMGSLAFLLGALGLGIGFGMQNIVNNFVSGLILLFERPIKVGDWIDLDGISGRVSDIGARSTKVVTPDNITIIIPNGNCLSQRLTNWSYNGARVRIRLPVGVAYGSPLEKVREALIEVADQHPQVVETPKPTVFFEEFADSQLSLELAVWIDVGSIGLQQLRSDLYFEIDRIFREREIEIPFPQSVLHLASDKRNWPD